jgi:hypothetical protein
MSLPEKIWEENPLKKLAEESLKKPGMYLIALRAHVRQGKTLIGDMIETVAEALPKPGKAQVEE